FGTPYIYDADAADADGDRLTYSLTQAPASMSIDPATGQINWTPTVSPGDETRTEYQAIDFSTWANTKLSSLGAVSSTFPTGSFVANGVPFFIPISGNNLWHSELATGPNPRFVDIPVEKFGVTAVDTLINTYWGQHGPNSYATVEFFGSGGAYYKK